MLTTKSKQRISHATDSIMSITSLALVVILLLLPAFFHTPNIAQEKSIHIVAIYTLFSTMLVLSPLAFIRPAFFCYLSIPFLLVMPFELIHVINYDGYTTLAAFVSTLETNPNEALEFQHNYRHYLYILYPIIIIGILGSIYYVRHHHRLHKKTRTAIFALFIATLLLFTAKTIYEQELKGINDYTPGLSELYTRLFSQNFPFSYFIKGRNYLKQREEVLKSLEQKKDFIFGATSDKEALSLHNPVIILVIGETSRAHNWQLNGYKRNTNPELVKRKDIFYFKNAISAATHTNQTIQLVLSRATPRNLNPIYSEKSIVTAFSEAGYKTFWISNQNMTGGVETTVYSISLEADKRIFTNTDYEVRSEFDEALIPALEKTLSENTNAPLFIVIHTMGSHEVYRNRYPENFEEFRPASKGDDYNFSSPDIKERLLNSYDNSILYTDYILDKLIEVTASTKRPSTLSYFSDHGENLLDDENNRFGHGGVIPTQYVTNIPMFIWTSNEFLSHRPEFHESILVNTMKPVSSLYLFDTLLDLGSINIDGYKNANSLANNNFTASDIYILNTEYKALNLGNSVIAEP